MYLIRVGVCCDGGVERGSIERPPGLAACVKTVWQKSVSGDTKIKNKQEWSSARTNLFIPKNIAFEDNAINRK